MMTCPSSAPLQASSSEGRNGPLPLPPARKLQRLSVTFRLALTTIPILLALLVVVFTTRDAWQLYGDEALVRFTALMCIILAASIIAIFRVVTGEEDETGWRSMILGSHTKEQPGHETDQSGAEKKFVGGPQVPNEKIVKAIEDVDIAPSDLQKTGAFWGNLTKYNAYALFWFTIIGQILAVMIWVSLLFMILGLIVVDQHSASDLLSTPPDIAWHFTFLGQSFILTRQLILLSITLGAVAALTFATLGLQDDRGRQIFINHSLGDLKQSLIILRYYLAGIRALWTMLPQKDRELFATVATRVAMLVIT
jgi:hypothetical protein